MESRKPQLTVLYLQHYRLSDPAISINQDAISYISKHLRSLISFYRKDITKQSPSELIRTLTSIDILLAATNPALAFAVFLVPRSGVVEVMAENYRSGFYHRLAVSSDLYYLSHTNFTDTFDPIENCSYSVRDEEIWDREPSCRKAFLMREVYVHPITLWMIMTDMAKSVHHNKYHIFQFLVCFNKLNQSCVTNG